MKISFVIVLLLAFSLAQAAPGRVRGYVDSVRRDGVRGWACQQHVSKSINIHIYARGPAGRGGVFVKSVRADRHSDHHVGRACGTKFNRYRYAVSFSSRELAAHSGQRIYVHGIPVHGRVPNSLLTNSGRFSLPSSSGATASPGRVRGFIDSVRSGRISGWACQKHVAKSIYVHVYARGPAGRGAFVKSVRADRHSEHAVAHACGTKFNRYRYVVSLTSRELQVHQGQRIYVHGIAAHRGVPNDLLANSGRFSLPRLFFPGDPFPHRP